MSHCIYITSNLLNFSASCRGWNSPLRQHLRHLRLCLPHPVLRLVDVAFQRCIAFLESISVPGLSHQLRRFASRRTELYGVSFVSSSEAFPCETHLFQPLTVACPATVHLSADRAAGRQNVRSILCRLPGNLQEFLLPATINKCCSCPERCSLAAPCHPFAIRQSRNRPSCRSERFSQRCARILTFLT